MVGAREWGAWASVSRWSVALVVGGGVSLAAQVGQACPACSGSREEGIGTSLAIGAMMLLPYVVVGLVGYFIVKRRSVVEGQ